MMKFHLICRQHAGDVRRNVASYQIVTKSESSSIGSSVSVNDLLSNNEFCCSSVCLLIIFILRNDFLLTLFVLLIF